MSARNTRTTRTTTSTNVEEHKPAPREADRPEYVDDRGLSTRTPISRVTWQVMRQKGEGPAFYRVGRRCVYRWDEVANWLESRRVA
ncbi:MAG: hypothetical protein NT062_04255 [Proteobacteria bacterium]|nr:hypothetical protein [Pseudomonadota bacterium]